MVTTAIGRSSPAVPPLDPSVFAVTRKWAYCNHAAVGPLPKPARDAVVKALDAQAHDGCAGILDVEARKESVRLAVARAIGARADEIAFMRSTSDGALLVANGLGWREGDEIVFSDNEFGANAYPWLNLRDLGVATIMLRAPQQRLTVETLERVATDRTRLVAVSQVGFVDGYRHDLAALGAWCRARGILFAVDAIQGFGQMPLDVNAWNVDFCYFGVAKWLLSPQGLSVVYVRREHLERIRPSVCSWRSVRDPLRFLDYAQEFADGAQRFEGGTLNYAALVGFAESLALLVEAGMGSIDQHVVALGDRIIRQAQSMRLPVLSEVDPAVRSAIVVVGLGGHTVDELSKRANEAHVQVTIRENGVRIAPHGYNTERDIDRVMEIFA